MARYEPSRGGGGRGRVAYIGERKHRYSATASACDGRVEREKEE